MTTVSCIIITTLVVVSLANLILLVHVIMQSMGSCQQGKKNIPRVYKREDSFKAVPKAGVKFSAALVVLFSEAEDYVFICGVAIISKQWVITAAHCADSVLDEPQDQVKISSGARFDIDKIMLHEEYKASPLTSNVALVKIQQFFKEKEFSLVPVAGKGFRYLANSSAVAVGWVEDDVLVADVRLLSHKNCEGIYLDGINDAMFCAERKFCSFDFGGFLVQRNSLIGVVAFGVGCEEKPVVYTKLALFEDWLKEAKTAAAFKD